jgi:hypothetical protein
MVDQRRSIVEASKLLSTSSYLSCIPSEGDDAALNAMAREYLAHFGYADTIAALDRVAPPPKAVHSDTAALQDKKGVLTFLNSIKQGRLLFDTTDSIQEGQLTVARICGNLPEDVGAQLWLWWTLHVATWAPELVDADGLMPIVLRGSATGNLGAAIRLAEQCIHFVNSKRSQPSTRPAPRHTWRRTSAPTAPSSPIDGPHLDALYVSLLPSIQKHYGRSKRPRGGMGLPTTLQEVGVWSAHEQQRAALRWHAVLAED